MEQKTPRKIAILGFGREGKSTLRFLQKSHNWRNSKFWIVDKKSTIELPSGIRGRLGKNYLKNLAEFDIVFRSPGIPYELPELWKARRNGTLFSSATKLFFDHCPTKNIIGITGTKGKGTTSTLLYQIFKAHSRNSRQAARRRVFLAGNIGKSALDILPKLKKDDRVILELSSFQLQDLKKSPHIAVVLDVFPDHQDSHKNLNEYYEAKTSIARYQKPGDRIFFFGDNPMSRRIAQRSGGKKISVKINNFRLFGPENLKILGRHNFKNAVMAAIVAKYLGISDKTIVAAIKNFRGLEHRLEFVRRIRYPKLRIRPNAPNKKIRGIRVNSDFSYRFIDFYNDSASTNPQTSAAAIKAFPEQSKILIAGGQDKGLDYKPLAQAIKNSDVKLVVLIGENKKKIYKAIKKSGAPVKFAKNITIAIKLSYATAKNLPLSVILFSPASASFDMFRDYADRGTRFKKMVKRLQ